MPKLNVKVDTFDDHSLFSHKTIQLGSKSIETPTKAIQIGETTKNDNILDEVRGANEIYFSTNPGKLAKAREEFKPSFKKNIGQALNKGNDDEFNFVFAQFGSERRFDDSNLDFLLDTIYSTSDFVTVPLMSDLVSAIEDDGDGTDSIYFKTYKENVKRFIETAEQLNSKPIMERSPNSHGVSRTRLLTCILIRGFERSVSISTGGQLPRNSNCQIWSSHSSERLGNGNCRKKCSSTA